MRRLATILTVLATLMAGAWTMNAWTSSAWALEPEERLSDPVLESRARTLSSQLRCVVCQNQSIDESNADLAADMRRLVRQRLVEGDSDEAVRQYLVDRYGDYVLLQPPIAVYTVLLWAAPIVLLTFGGFALFFMVRARARPASQTPLSESERRRLARLLDRDDTSDTDKSKRQAD